MRSLITGGAALSGAISSTMSSITIQIITWSCWML